MLLEHLRVRLRDHGVNEITIAFEACGLCPWNRQCSNWLAASSSLGMTAELSRGNVEAVIEANLLLGCVDVGAEASEVYFGSVALGELGPAEREDLARLALDEDGGKLDVTAARVVTECWRLYAALETPSFMPTCDAQKAAFKACGSPHERAVLPLAGAAEKAHIERGRARAGALVGGEAAPGEHGQERNRAAPRE